jgi:uncharacterized oligopeptide transporter (OPT) family protein
METTLIEIIAGAIGLAPFTSGCTSFIPALEFLATPEENGPIRFSLGSLLLWGVATCGLGVVVGAPFRSLFILREQLRYPSGTATGTLIGVLFRRGEIMARAHPTDLDISQLPQSHEARPGPEFRRVDTGDDFLAAEPEFVSDTSNQHFAQEVNGSGISILLYSLAGSASFVSYPSPLCPSEDIIVLIMLAECHIVHLPNTKATAYIRSFCF